MANSNSTPIISNPCAAMFGVSVRSDGTFENVGIGSFDLSKANELADRLLLMADAIRGKADKQAALLKSLE